MAEAIRRLFSPSGKESPRWRNWSGSLTFDPSRIMKPSSYAEVVDAVRSAVDKGRTLRVVGAGHSSTPLVETSDILLSLEKRKGVVSVDHERGEATFLPGMTVGEAASEFLRYGMTMHNTGDVDVQYLAGAIGTGTHGTGKKLQNLSGMLKGGSLVSGKGEVVRFDYQSDPELLNALRVSLGCLGVFLELKVGLIPAIKLERKEWCAHIDDCLSHLQDLIDSNRNFDFYWYPRSDRAKIRIANLPGEGQRELPYARCVKSDIDWLGAILPQKRDLKFDEMEYAVPLDRAAECFREVRERIKERHRRYVGWRVLFRTVAADETMLSPFYRRQSATIAVLQNNDLEFWEYFKDIEPIFLKYEGRPHWGKKHTLKASQLKKMYPEWEKFLALRKRMDPEGVFLNGYLKELLGV